MSITFDMLLDAEPRAYRTAATAWDRLARALDDRADSLTASVKRIPDAWEGDAGTAATAHCDGLRKEVETAYVPVLATAQALTRHADGLEELREHAHDLVAEGRRLHVTINRDGSMTANPGHYDEWTARSMSSLVWQRDELLRAAADLDGRTARILADNTATASGAPSARVDRGSIPAAGTDPARVKAWWDSLSPAQQRYVLAEYPELVGNLDGLPVAARDIANRIVLDREHDRLAGRLDDLNAREAYIRAMAAQGRGAELYPGAGNPAGMALDELERIQAEREEIEGKLRGIDKITGRLEDPDQPRSFLVGFSTADDGRAIVSVGNPDEADNVLTYVPGTGADLSKVGGDIDRADRMALDAGKAAPDEDTAVVFWLGYDAPDTIPAATGDRYADGAVADLSRFQTGLRVTHEGPASHNTVLGHSYGSTAIGHTALQTGIDADALIFVGSPGVDTNHASDLKGVSPDQVWATRAEHDIIKRVPDWDVIHGNDPTRKDFGGRVFTSDPGDPDNEGATHSAYWDPNNAARRNIAYIVTGQGGQVR